VPGEDLPGILSAREFVAWYNGLPGYEDLNPPLSGHGNEAVVIGQGNVALDVARMLIADVDDLRHTDTPEAVLEALTRNDFKSVHIVGRRGPTQAAFTIKEIRELVSSNKRLEPVPALLFPSDPKLLPRPRQRIATLLQSPKNNPASAPNNTDFRFFLSPTSFESDSSSGFVQRSTFVQTKFVGDLATDDPLKFESDTRVEIDTAADPVSIQSGIVFRSIGYKAEPLPGLAEAGIPFNNSKGIIPNVQGWVTRSDSTSDGFIPGVYVTGWVKRGPTGVIATTMADAFETADLIVANIRKQQNQMTGSPGEGVEIDGTTRSGWEEVRKLLPSDARPVSWEDWQRIDAVEKERGAALGKPREKITNVKDMLKVLDG
jgi:adrenodoxin-NADP+ reductase